MTSQPPFFIVDDVQQIHQIPEMGDWSLADDILHIHSGPLGGQKYHSDFVHPSEEAAKTEITNRHTRLNRAFSALDLLGCLSINKEPQRRTLGLSWQDLVQEAKKDKEQYQSWLQNLEQQWEKINHEKPDLGKLANTLKNAALIQQALQNPLAIDFIEIMSREDKLKKAKAKAGPTLE